MIDALLVQIATSYINYGVRNKEPQLGQYYIAEYAHAHGFTIRIKKYLSSDPIVTQLTALIGDLGCQIIGFYVDCLNQWVIRRILFEIKEAHPTLCVIIGGPQVTGAPQLALRRILQADIAIIGEGEVPFTQLLSIDWRNENALKDIKGLVYRKGDGTIHTTDTQVQSTEITQYPFPRRRDYSLDTDIIFDQISTGRGCVGQCAFCFEGSKKNNLLRLRSVEDVIEEIDYIVSHLGNQKFFSFLDDTFVIHSERTKKICQHLINKYSGDIRWFCEARVDVLYNHLELIPLMLQAGLLRVQLGGESGSQMVLDAYRKHMKVDELKCVVRHLYKCGVPSIYINFIIGGAFETLETFNETLELAIELMEIAPGCAEVGCSIFTPYVGTPMYNCPEHYGISILDKNILCGLDGFMSFSETDSLSRYKISHLYSLFESEISKKMDELCEELSYNRVLQKFELYRDFGLADKWMETLKHIEAIEKYFNALFEVGFYSIKQLTLESIQGLVPYRTKEPVSDGEAFFRNTYRGKYIKTTGLEESVFLLSSGKITFSEIVYLLSKKQEYSMYSNLEDRVFNIYKQLDKEYLIIWKKDL